MARSITLAIVLLQLLSGIHYLLPVEAANPVCTSGVYKHLMSLSSDAMARVYCVSEYPQPPVTWTVSVTTTSTALVTVVTGTSTATIDGAAAAATSTGNPAGRVRATFSTVTIPARIAGSTTTPAEGVVTTTNATTTTTSSSITSAPDPSMEVWLSMLIRQTGGVASTFCSCIQTSIVTSTLTIFTAVTSTVSTAATTTTTLTIPSTSGTVPSTNETAFSINETDSSAVANNTARDVVECLPGAAVWCPLIHPGLCIDFTKDAINCGKCGLNCGPKNYCLNKVCMPLACPPQTAIRCPKTQPGRCIDFNYDPQNCGGCGLTCGPDSWCRDRTCIPLEG